MTLMEVLKSDKWYRDFRVVNGYRWLIWDETVWVVYAREAPLTKTSELIVTEDEELAVRYLLYQEV